MWQPSKSLIHVLCAATLWLAAGGASAQVNPELGDVGASGQVTTQTTATTTTTRTDDNTTVDRTDDRIDSSIPNRYTGTDHGRVVGRFGIGFFGVLGIPIPGIDA